MPRRTAAIAKLTVPGTKGAVPRHRLFRLIDQLHGRAPHLWLSSPGGSGKTVLVSGYLREKKIPCLWFQMDDGDSDPSTFFYYLGLAAPRPRSPLPLFTAEYHQAGARNFARRFFEKLGARLPPHAAIVFDNCESVADDTELLATITEGLQYLPESVGCIFISRHGLPKEFSILKIKGKIEAIGWEEMKLTAEETAKIASSRGWPRPEAHHLHKRSGGWMAGLVVMLEQARLEGSLTAVAPASQQALFDYFSQDIFNRMPEEPRLFLVKSAFLTAITPEAGTRLSGNRNSGRILAELYRNNFFTERLAGSPEIYQYHPLFRQFLRQQCQALLPKEQVREIKQASALILAEADELAAAIHLLTEADDFQRALELLLANAFSLISQGRNKTFLELIESLPAEPVAAIPWAGFWHGLAIQPYDPARARDYFAEAFAGFKKAGDFTGMLRCWSNLVETVFHQWNDFTQLDPWIAWLDEVSSQDPFEINDPVLNLQVSSAMTAALTMRGGAPQKMRAWAERAIRALQPAQNPYARASALMYCVNYFSWVHPPDLDAGTMEMCLCEAEQAKLPPILRLTAIYTRVAWSLLQPPDMGMLLKNVYQALTLAEESGIHVWDEIFYGLGVYCAVVLGDRDASASFTEKMRAGASLERKQGLAFYFYVKAWDRLTFGSPGEAREAIGKAIQLYAQTGYEFPSNVVIYAAATICAEEGALDQALAFAARADAVAAKFDAYAMRYSSLMVLAYVHLKRGEHTEAAGALGKALGLARAGRFYHLTWWWHGPLLPTLAELAIRENIERDYAVELIRKLQLVPTHPDIAPVEWPWPVKLTTLGHFELLVDDWPAEQGRKAQQKTLALLKALAAADPEGQGVIRLADLLWPDADGDKARHALEMAAHRARKLLGRDDAVQSRQGRLRLAPAICRVDAHAFALGIDAALAPLNDGRREEAVSLLERTLPIYQGPFLAGDDDDWVLPVREKLLLKFLAGAEKLGALYETAGDFEQALSLYRRTFDLAESSEEMGRHLIRCCLQTGRRSEAATAYRRLERAMQAVLGLGPAAETQKMLTVPSR